MQNYARNLAATRLTMWIPQFLSHPQGYLRRVAEKEDKIANV